MKNLIVLSLMLLVSLGTVQSQEFRGLDKSPLDMIEYPSSNQEPNKLALVPEGKIWRMGANESTELTLYVPMKIGGSTIDAGSYTLYAIPNGEQMTVIVNKAIHVWGAYSYDQEMDVVRVNVPVSESEDLLEAFSMAFEGVDDGVHLHMGWGNYRVKVALIKA
jgi:hypothetical protein